jgi:hypothetical protein
MAPRQKLAASEEPDCLGHPLWSRDAADRHHLSVAWEDRLGHRAPRTLTRKLVSVTLGQMQFTRTPVRA